MLARDEPAASITAEALEGFASGRFETKVEVKRFLESNPLFPRRPSEEGTTHQRAEDILTQPLYAGYLHVPNWDIGLREARHKGLISLSTYQRIQERLKEKAKAPARKDLNTDFPLRGFVACRDCGSPLTACWSKSKTGKRHTYYLCYADKECPSYRKSIRRDDIERAFESLLKNLKPTKALAELVHTMMRDAWD